MKTDRTGEPTVELRLDDDGKLDDVVIRTPTLFRMERMDTNQWWIGVDVAGEDRVVFWIHSKDRIDITTERD